MDFNIACALYFASKGEGYIFNNEYIESEEFKNLKKIAIGSIEKKKE